MSDTVALGRPWTRTTDLPTLDRAPAREGYALRHLWTDGLGVTWDLSDCTTTGGRVTMRPDLLGLAGVQIERRTTRSPALHGARQRSWIADEGEVFWPLTIAHPGSSQEYLDHKRAFLAGLHPELEGRWQVVQPNGTARWLGLRYVSKDYRPDIDDALFGYAVYGVTLAAPQPFWRGDPVEQTWSNAEESYSMFPEEGDDFVLGIGSGSTVVNASVANPGDVESYPVWKVEGPVDEGTTVGTSGRLTTLSVPLDEGEVRVIDAHPDRQGVYDEDGVKKRGELSAAAFGPVPAGAKVPLALSMVGEGSVSLRMDTLYLEPV